MEKKISFDVKEKMVGLAGACFWFWDSFYSFLDSSGVSKSLQKHYPQSSHNKYQVMRNILSDLESNGDHEVINAIVSNFYTLRGGADKDNLDEKKAQRLLQEFRDIVGDNPIEVAIKQRDVDAARTNYKNSIEDRSSRDDKLLALKTRFLGLVSDTNMTPQQRGYVFEVLFFDLLHFSEIEHTKPYRTQDGEQIDGHFKYEKFDYLVEIKWIAGFLKQKDLSIFDGKIRGKAQSTRGFFIAAEGFDENAIQKFSGDTPRILLMTGEDLTFIFEGKISLFDALKLKIDGIVRFGKINTCLRNINY